MLDGRSWDRLWSEFEEESSRLEGDGLQLRISFPDDDEAAEP